MVRRVDGRPHCPRVTDALGQWSFERRLSCSNNELSSLDLSSNPELYSFGCDYNNLTSLNVSQNTKLLTLNCSYNQLVNIDISKCSLLKWFSCYKNQLEALNLSTNVNLISLLCNDNKLSSLDISKNTQITAIDISSMVTLNKVCVWVTPFPPTSVNMNAYGSTNAFFSTDCAKWFTLFNL